MNKHLILILALLLIVAYPSISKDRPISADSSSIPQDISEFYEDYNFVTSFSTLSERDALIDCFLQDVLQEDIRTDRMNRVFQLMKKFPPIFCPLPPIL